MPGTMQSLDGTVAIVTGAGQGLGREHAGYLARHGAAVVVNDIGDDEDGRSLADVVVAEIVAEGGRASSARDSVATFAGAEAIVHTAVAEFGGLDIVVNNAGGPRHSALLDMPEETWDTVVDVNLKGTFAMTRAAGRHWRRQVEEGRTITASIVNTTSRAGLFPGSGGINGKNAGMANYGAAKAGVWSLSEISARELAWLGVRVNCISPSARTRLTAHGALADLVAPPADGAFDEWDPANISPLVAWLAAPACTLTGQIYWIKGGQINAMRTPYVADVLERHGAWSLDLLDEHEEWFQKLASARVDFPDA